MNDSFGDGWNGAIYEIYDWVTGALFASGTQAGSFEQASFCMPDGCYYIEVGGGSFDSEISWTLNGVNNGPIAGGAPSGQVYFSVGGGSCETCQEENACNYDLNAPVSDCNLCEYTSCAGCTYPEALNYDTVTPATLDDGSCVFCLGDFDNNGFINTSDLLAFLTGFGLPC